MGAIRIVTDTTASLPPGYAAAHAVEVVPQVVLFGEESFFEEVQLSYAEFIRRLKDSAVSTQRGFNDYLKTQGQP